MPTAYIDDNYNKEHQGDIFECAVARMWFGNQPTALLALLEECTTTHIRWEDRANMEAAEAKINAMYHWKPTPTWQRTMPPVTVPPNPIGLRLGMTPQQLEANVPKAAQMPMEPIPKKMPQRLAAQAPTVQPKARPRLPLQLAQEQQERPTAGPESPATVVQRLLEEDRDRPHVAIPPAP